jgi:hypothetical protein
MEDNETGSGILKLIVCKCLVQDLMRKPRKSSVMLAEIWAEICRKDLPGYEEISIVLQYTILTYRPTATDTT